MASARGHLTLISYSYDSFRNRMRASEWEVNMDKHEEEHK